RNAGNDTAYSYLRDNMNQNLVRDRNITSQAMAECVVFIDGEFWGFYTLTEKIGDSYIKSHYGIKKKDVVIIKNAEVEEGTDDDWREWNDTIAKYARADMTADENYSAFCADFDVDSVAEYFSMQIYWCNSDWPWNNVAVWKSRTIDSENSYADGRWRMLLFDTDFSAGLFQNNETTFRADGFSRVKNYKDSLSRTFFQLMRNSDFKERFYTVFMDMANGNFSSERTDRMLENYVEAYRTPIIDTLERFYAGSFVYRDGTSRFDTECGVIRDFYRNRFGFAVDDLKNHIGLSGSLKKINIQCNAWQGRVEINTLKPDFSSGSWKGQYFSDYEITLKAIPEKNYKFVRWEVIGATADKNLLERAELKIKPENDIYIRAVYDKK
ncbi:MAG: CotH kinase family protein, partial [Ruminococcus sp.]|nr:CotH kinase family protein [Ruminococcus sp.]